MTSIGIYDSGLGGLTVLRSVQTFLPRHDLLYLADTAFCPYGSRAVEEVRERARVCANWLVAQGVGLLVVACNTASSAALELLRIELPVPVVGMEPGIKPAIETTQTRQVGVLATGGTLASTRFASLVQRFAAQVAVHTVPCPGLVEQVEAGDLDGPLTRALLQDYLATLQAHEVDTIVLGCTHFPFLTPLIQDLVGPHVTIIDTGPAVARQVARVAAAVNVPLGSGRIRFVTTGDPAQVALVLGRLGYTQWPVEQILAHDQR